MTKTFHLFLVSVILASTFAAQPAAAQSAAAQSAAAPPAAGPLVLVSASYQKDVIALCELDGTVIWRFATGGPERGHAGHHEIQMLDNDNVLYHDDWDHVKEIGLDGKLVRKHASSGVHAFTRLRDGNTMIAESGRGRIVLIDPQDKIVRETPLGPDGRNKTRQAEILENGDYLVCAEKPGMVTQYSPDGTIVWEYEIGTRVYGAIRLSNGNTMICSGSGRSIVEVNSAKEIVWEAKDRIPAVKAGRKIELHWTACLKELPGGHIMLANCHAGPDQPQLIELDAERKVVWQFNEFELVGNGMASFDYIESAQASRIRTKLTEQPIPTAR